MTKGFGLALLAATLLIRPATALELNGITITNNEGHDVSVVMTDCNDKPLTGNIILPKYGGVAYHDDEEPVTKFDCLVIKSVPYKSR